MRNEFESQGWWNAEIATGGIASSRKPLEASERTGFATTMSQEQWSAVRHVTDTLLEPDPVLDAALKASSETGVPTGSSSFVLPSGQTFCIVLS